MALWCLADVGDARYVMMERAFTREDLCCEEWLLWFVGGKGCLSYSFFFVSPL